MNGKWITCNKETETPMFSRSFCLNNYKNVKIDVSGLGYFTLLINGKRVTDDLFTPAQTDYAPRDTSKFTYPIFDAFSHKVYYLRYDITPYVNIGNNLIEIIVGNGWYRQYDRTAEGNMSFGDSLLCVYDVFVDDELYISSDGSEKCFVYPITKSNLFYGETMDTTLFLKPFAEVKTQIAEFNPDMYLQDCPSDKVIRTEKPVIIDAERNIYDVGENITGWVKMALKGNCGDAITLRFAEYMNDGKLSFDSAGSDDQIQTDRFILNGNEQTVSPMFVFHGFRYFDISGNADILGITVEVIHTDVSVTSSFECSNDTVNWYYDAYIRSQLGNYHGCVPSDCPTRERLGYTGDGQVCCEAAMLSLDVRELYLKWIDDIKDCQDVYSGHIQHTAPFMGGGGGPGGWGSAIIIVPYTHYLYYHDISVLKHAYLPMKRWISYMLIHSEQNILSSEEKDGWCLGDWCALPKTLIPADYVNTCYMIVQLEYFAEISKVLEKSEFPAYIDMAEDCRKALYNKYYNNSSYCDDVKGANAFAVWAKLPQYKNLIKGLGEKYSKSCAFDTGIFGTPILLEILFKHGMGDIALQLLTSENPDAGFYKMKTMGMTTLTETLDCGGSFNHPMFGASSKMLFKGILGINPRSLDKGYKDIVISPSVDCGLDRAKGSIKTIYGNISVEFDRLQGYVEIIIPDGINAVYESKQLKSGMNRFSIS